MHNTEKMAKYTLKIYLSVFGHSLTWRMKGLDQDKLAEDHTYYIYLIPNQFTRWSSQQSLLLTHEMPVLPSNDWFLHKGNTGI